MNDLREIWRDFPPWLKTFLLGLALAIAAPTLTALESLDTATDWRVWLGGAPASRFTQSMRLMSQTVAESTVHDMSGSIAL